jgi:hypothetical protein
MYETPVVSSGYMSRSKQSDGPLPPAPEYAKWLATEVEKARISPKEVGYTRVTHWRSFSAPDQLTASAAFAYMRALRKKRVFMPPPLVQVLDAEDYEWITLGRALREVNRSQWQALLETVRIVAGAARDGLGHVAAAEELVMKARQNK